MVYADKEDSDDSDGDGENALSSDAHIRFGNLYFCQLWEIHRCVMMEIFALSIRLMQWMELLRFAIKTNGALCVETMRGQMTRVVQLLPASS